MLVDYSFAYLVDFVREVQDVLGLASAHIVSHSMGGWVAALLAYESPERVRTLTLVANGGMSTATPPMMRVIQMPTREELVQYARGIGRIQEGEIEEAVERRLARVERSDAVAAYTLIMRHMTHPVHRDRYNLRRRLPYIGAPTLIVWRSLIRSTASILARKCIDPCPRHIWSFYLVATIASRNSLTPFTATHPVFAGICEGG
ncbi:hypothetical protein GCM10025858_31630 [Alicyclobacillus sacchari]|nr:hypothetical protein GCM10025858_31630 [Alicyclobacillus sacchari]